MYNYVNVASMVKTGQIYWSDVKYQIPILLNTLNSYMFLFKLIPSFAL